MIVTMIASELEFTSSWSRLMGSGEEYNGEDVEVAEESNDSGSGVRSTVRGESPISIGGDASTMGEDCSCACFF